MDQRQFKGTLAREKRTQSRHQRKGNIFYIFYIFYIFKVINIFQQIFKCKARQLLPASSVRILVLFPNRKEFVCDTDMHLITNGPNPKTDGIRIGHLRSNPARKLQIYCYIFSPTTVPLKF